MRLFLKNKSRDNFYKEVKEGESLNNDEIQLGALLRIADSLEKMAELNASIIKQNQELTKEVSSLKKSREYYKKHLVKMKEEVREHKRKK